MFKLRALWRATRGASLVEYIAIVGFVALAALLAFQRFGVSLYSKVRTEGDHVVSLTPMQGGSTYCFAAGTPVATPEGARPIETIREGDWVLSRDLRTGETAPHRALRIFVTPDASLVEVRVRGSDAPILATPGHLFATRDRGWIAAATLDAGEALASAHGVAIVENVRPHAERATVYNFEVEETHTYFVGDARALVHNPSSTDCSGNPLGSSPPGTSTSCFVAGTPVSTPDGARPIESLRVGDAVVSRDEASGEVAPARVKRTLVRAVHALVDVRVEASNGALDVVRATPEHPFWTWDRGWTPAARLTPAEALVDAQGRPLLVVSVTPVELDALVYNVEVEGAHTYFVGTHAAWVHNACDFFAQLYGNPPSPPIVSSQSIGAAIEMGQIPQNGVGNYQITQNGAIQPGKPTSLWNPSTWTSTSTQFQGQYIGLNGSDDEPIDPNVDYVFTDNLSGCGVAVAPGNAGAPPSMIHAPCANVAAISNPPADTNLQWNQNMQQYLHDHGYNPGQAIIVNNSLYGWDNASANDPSAPLPNAFFYGIQDGSPKVWKFKLVTTDPQTGEVKIIPVGQLNPRS